MTADDPDTAIAELIAGALRSGMIHPGDPERDIPATPIVLPFKAAPGQPPEMVKLLDGTVKLLSEALVHLIKTEGGVELVPRDEAAGLRAAAGQAPVGPQLAAVHCRCDTRRADPLAILTVQAPGHFTVDGGTFLRGLARRSPACPHPIDSTATDADLLLESINDVIGDLPKRDVSTKARALIAEAIEQVMG